MELDFFPHAQFSIQAVNESYVYIKDIGTNAKSVTNDAEWVLQGLMEEYDLKGRRIIYMDSTGTIDEILHAGGRFTGFKSGHDGIEL